MILLLPKVDVVVLRRFPYPASHRVSVRMFAPLTNRSPALSLSPASQLSCSHEQKFFTRRHQTSDQTGKTALNMALIRSQTLTLLRSSTNWTQMNRQISVNLLLRPRQMSFTAVARTFSGMTVKPLTHAAPGTVTACL